jgi:predicted NBD/HSP70 family sugar kinase
LLRIVRAAQRISRAELARRLKVSRSTVTELVRPLLASGVLCEGVPEQTSEATVGRPPNKLSLCPTSSVLAGINIGVRQSQVGIARADGRILAEDAFDTPRDPAKALSMIRSSLERLLEKWPGNPVEVIGVSVPGPTDPDRSRLLYAPHLGWKDVAIAESLRGGRFNTEARKNGPHIIVENDATAAANFEAVTRLLENNSEAWRDFILVRAGSGIGVGLVLGGDVYRGVGQGDGLVGEFGHMTIVAGGKQCVCGNRGCWERYASAASTAALYAGDRVQTSPRFAEIVARAEAGERRAQATLEQVGEYLGIGIGNVIGGFGISHVVVSGRIVLAWKFIQAPLYKAVDRTMAGRLVDWSVAPGVPHGSGLGGALEVAIDHYLTMLSA